MTIERTDERTGERCAPAARPPLSYNKKQKEYGKEFYQRDTARHHVK